jgi:large subunit ribosomal protein L6
MSRLGKFPIKLEGGAKAQMEDNFIIVHGPKGELKQAKHDAISFEISDTEIKINIKDFNNKKEKALWGLYRSLIKNMVEGVTHGFEKKLEINGVGYKAAISGNKLTLNLGFSHPVVFILPAGVNGKVENNVITLSGIDKQLIGEVTANIRKIRKPEPYKGKGIKYSDEIIRRKEGKTASKGS